LQILQLLPRTTIYECILVCKSWTSAALQEYYKEVSISKYTTPFFRTRSQAEIHHMLAHGNIIRRLKIYGRFTQSSPEHLVLTKDEFSILLHHLPCLTKIDLTGCSWYDIYLGHLIKAIEDDKDDDKDNNKDSKYVKDDKVNKDNKNDKNDVAIRGERGLLL
jgi:hypothetical protein